VPTSNPRNRVVVFRLTEEEYRTLKAACSAVGDQSVAEYTRSELLLALHSDGTRMTIQRRFHEIDHKLRDVTHLLNQVFAYLRVESNADPANTTRMEQES